MKSIQTLIVAVLLACCAMTVVLATDSTTSNFRDALYNYVHSPSSVFSYKLVDTAVGANATVYTLNVTSVAWLPESEIGSTHIWYHYVTVAIPNNLNRANSQGFFFITNGDVGLPAPGISEANSSPPNIVAYSSKLASTTKSIAANLFMIPNQVMTYNSDPAHLVRREDAIIGYGWEKFMNNTSSNLLYVTQLPMVKASKLAMDAVVQFVQQTLNYQLESFAVSGASKRGWTTILLGGVDHRVKSIIPLVIPTFGTAKFIEHTYNNLCAWPWAFYDYVTNGVTDYLYKPQFESLTDIVDPLNYRRLKSIPKYQVMAMGDEFFAPDLNDLSYRQVKGEKYVRYVPNSGHSMSGSDVMEVLLTYQYARLNNIALPKYTFTREWVSEGVIINVRVKNGKKPTRVSLWQATNPNGRDFRTTTIGANVWTSTVLSEVKPFEWQVLVRNPSNGYTAATVELVFENYIDGVELAPLKFTTNAYVTPNTTPCEISPTNLPSHQLV
ncbi:hypothetical protein C9374_001477 [Naegleria lovaniensis]|uniref:Uncharacterized protein n=1 Tax=Naegleria lovaniensis TaxID=51637 RepID=A0AA88KKU4_NAELO|nr:uncharacterized protein C9374_001477 [Naegleria lovaniensis]KAG2387145.1 hypothetical protein C9374_001477 [Naegleria lovaniensis]